MSVEAPNLLREGLRRDRTAGPCAMVIFGASGDLTSRKLVPALYNLALQRLLPAEFAVVGIGRHPHTDDTLRAELREAAQEYSRTRPIRPEVWDSFAECFYYLRGDPKDPDTYQRLGARLADLDRTRGTGGNRLFYLATPPSLFPAIVGPPGAGANRLFSLPPPPSLFPVIVGQLGAAGLNVPPPGEQGEPHPDAWVRL